MSEISGRFRLASDIDLSVADKDCKRCKGSGIVRYQVVSGSDIVSGKVPVICRCVTRNGGVSKDLYDRWLEEQAAEQVVGETSFVNALYKDLMTMDSDERDRVFTRIVESLQKSSVDMEKTELYRSTVSRAIDRLKEMMEDGDAE